MKSHKLFNRTGFISLLILTITLSICISGCATLRSISERFDNRMSEAISTMDNAIATLAQQSSNWQVVVANLEKELIKDLQSTIRTEVDNLTKSAVSSTGAEVRCNAEFMRIKIRRELINLRNSLAIDLNARLSKGIFKNFQIPLLPVEQVKPFICDIVPSAVDMSLDPERRTKIDIYGFDLRSLPISASYKTYGLFQAKTMDGPLHFLNVMQSRNFERNLATINDKKAMMEITSKNFARANLALSKEDISTSSFTLFAPTKLYDINISPSISVISDFHAVLDLSGSGANIPPNTKEILLSWDNAIQTEIPILTHEKVMECNTYDSIVVLQPLTFVPKAVTTTEYGGGGHPDTEFAGHGPCIEFSLSLSIDPSRKTLSATVFMDAWECPDDFDKIRSDYTEAIETKTFPLIQITDPDMIILGFNLEPYMSDRYIDTNTNPDTRYYSSGSPAYKIEFTGDTDGDEAGNETGAKITFNTIKLQVQKCGYK